MQHKKQKTAPLTPKQKKFLDIYLETGDGAQSVLDAGFKTSNPASRAIRLINNPKLRPLIEQHATGITEAGVSPAECIGFARKVREAAFDKDDLRTALAANEQVAKIAGLMISKSERKTVEASVDYNKLHEAARERLKTIDV